MKAKRIFLTSVIASAVFLSGCSVKVVNLTPARVPSNPSGIYTLSAQAVLDNRTVDPDSVTVSVVVDGEKHAMEESDLGSRYFDYEYAMPEGRDSARFYYVMNYRFKTLGSEVPELKEKTSIRHEFRLVDRYSIALDADRAPVGSQLTVLGRGFSRGDTVYVNGYAAKTTYLSPNSLQFFVPDLVPGQSYPVEIRGGRTNESAGILRVDPAIKTPLTVFPASIDLEQGARQVLVFSLENNAPEGGVYVNVTTDISNSIIMPEVIIPAGSRTVSITVEGGDPGTGSLFVKALNMRELVIPVSVR